MTLRQAPAKTGAAGFLAAPGAGAARPWSNDVGWQGALGEFERRRPERGLSIILFVAAAAVLILLLPFAPP
jgi:hypothetical protein